MIFQKEICLFENALFNDFLCTKYIDNKQVNPY